MKSFQRKILERYLLFWSKLLLRLKKPEIITITGSVGKTTTKEAIYRVLKEGGMKVEKAGENLNNEVGVPLAVLGFTHRPTNIFWPFICFYVPFKVFFFWALKFLFDYPEYWVLEMAVDRPGDIDYLSTHFPPKVGVVTNIGMAHLEFFESVERLIQEKMSLVENLLPGGIAVLNGDDDNIKNYVFSKNVQKICYGVEDDFEVTARGVKILSNGLEFDLVNGEEKEHFRTKILGGHSIYYFLASAAVAGIYHIPLSTVKNALESLEALPGRGRVFPGKKGTIVIDEAYNASPPSMAAALSNLEILGKVPREAHVRKIAVLGEMREIGEVSDIAHQEVGKLAHEVADLIIGVGEKAKLYQPDQWFADVEATARYLLGGIKENDIILIKGANALELAKLVKALES